MPGFYERSLHSTSKSARIARLLGGGRGECPVPSLAHTPPLPSDYQGIVLKPLKNEAVDGDRCQGLSFLSGTAVISGRQVGSCGVEVLILEPRKCHYPHSLCPDIRRARRGEKQTPGQTPRSSAVSPRLDSVGSGFKERHGKFYFPLPIGDVKLIPSTASSQLCVGGPRPWQESQVAVKAAGTSCAGRAGGGAGGGWGWACCKQV